MSRSARSQPLVMAVLNVTPDSFSDGGRFVSAPVALARAERMLEEGADVIDVGAESTRPGAAAVSAEEQLRRIGSLIADVVALGGACSVDTTSTLVAERALDAGATWINSVSLEPAKELAALAKRFDAQLVLMHSRGSMAEMAGFSSYAEEGYGDVVRDVAREWLAQAERALAADLDPARLWLDPGLGFQKSARQSLDLCARLDELCALGFQVLVGPSRKSFLARVTADPRDVSKIAPPEDRLGATIAAVIACVARGAAAVRVHDVLAVRQALAMTSALEACRSSIEDAREGRSSTPADPPGVRGSEEARQP